MTPTEPGAAHRVLLVDDDGAVRAMMNEGLQRKRFEVTTAASVTEALRRIATESFDVLINRGMEIWKTLRVSHIPTPPATTTDNCLTRRYTNIPLGTKDRSGQPSSRGSRSLKELSTISIGVRARNSERQVGVIS